MKDIVSKLQSLIYGTQKEQTKNNKTNAIIEDSESINNLVRNMKSSCSWKFMNKSNSKSRMRWKSNNFYSNAPKREYSDHENLNHKSSMQGLKVKRINDSLYPNATSRWNKSHIKSVKVYNFDNTERDNTLQEKMKTSRKTHKISTKMFKKFLKDYQEKVMSEEIKFFRQKSRQEKRRKLQNLFQEY